MLSRNKLFDPRLDDVLPVGYQPKEYNISFQIEETERRNDERVYVLADSTTPVRPRKFAAKHSRGSVQAVSRWGNPVVPIQRKRATPKRRLDHAETEAFVTDILNRGVR